jgi:hypothetical protein
MYLMNRQALGGYGHGTDHVLGTYNIGQCYCGASYYTGADGIGRIVSSGGNQAAVWRVVTAADAKPTLVQESIAPPFGTGQDSGFFTSISSNGTVAGSQIIWALTRPISSVSPTVGLVAFDPSTISRNGRMKRLVGLAAGSWPNGRGNANLVPLVADGKVFVASNKHLSIFGLSTAAAATDTADIQEPDRQQTLAAHEIYGWLKSFTENSFAILTRDSKMVIVDTTPAKGLGARAIPVVGRPYMVRGDYDKKHILHATSILRAKASTGFWLPDR